MSDDRRADHLSRSIAERRHRELDGHQEAVDAGEFGLTTFAPFAAERAAEYISLPDITEQRLAQDYLAESEAGCGKHRIWRASGCGVGTAVRVSCSSPNRCTACSRPIPCSSSGARLRQPSGTLAGMGALDGIRVVEAGLLVQGPQAAATLGEWGADVIKVELPGFGDQSRWLSRQPGRPPRPPYFIACNRGKRSVTIDLRVARRARALPAAGRAAPTSSSPTSSPARWRGGASATRTSPPATRRVVYAAGSTFGTVGPDANREGADLAAQAAGGLISTTGRRRRRPTPVGATIADHTASQNLVSGDPRRAARPRAHGPRASASTRRSSAARSGPRPASTPACLLAGPRRRAAPTRAAPLIPGVYAIFPTADGWIAIVGVAGPARDDASTR